VCPTQADVITVPIQELRDDMAGSMLGDRLLDVEKTVHSLHGYAKGAAWGIGIAVVVIVWWVNTDLLPLIHGLQTSLSTDEGRINTLEVTIKNANLKQEAATNPDAALREITKLPQAEFAGALPALRVISEQSVQKVNPSRATLEKIAQKLRDTDKSSPEYWPTVLQFLQFASTGLAPTNVPPPKPNPDLKSSGHISGAFTIKNLVVELDGGTLSDANFENCRVIFTEIPVQMTNVTFVNSVFELPISTSPPPFIQKATKVLLASDLRTVSFSGM
jgi:hypothetical protein